ncbi:hypothetical protein SCP_1503430 [Sparassis crispa]|uniref:Uncharacterized protein n=1 Tax=Sparassis crispa TaxID=139825 RepID=A0A401H4G7_9APHY|nr:hypothetical protein SCP_1503430 [Sparassis crispa]GBE89335.1 hypothetical protein SCP_1503430 [Sparassis crispa]
MRPLILHVSALNDSEYPLYIASLRDLAEADPDSLTVHDDAYYEGLKIGVREARAWLRGRYTTIAPPVVDSVLRLFCPNLGQTDAINGGQFFAVLRLITHVLHGKQVDSSLVFVQAHPDFPSSPAEPVHPPPSQPVVFDPPAPDVNPFFTPTVEKSRTSSPASLPDVVPPVPPKPSTNPFLARRPSAPGRASLEVRTLPLPTRQSLEVRTPPLPPRKPAAPAPPPRHSSLVVPQPRNTTHHGYGGPPTNTLIQQSLQAGRVAQSLKKAEERLEKERVLEVLKSSVPTSRRTRSISPMKDLAGSGSSKSPSVSSREREKRPTLPPRPRVSPPASSTATARSFEQVAHATVSSSPFRARDVAYQRSLGPLSKSVGARSPSRTPPRAFVDLPNEPPPMHPDLKPILAGQGDMVPPSPDSPGSPNSAPSLRTLRSKSVRSSSPPPVLPPLRRRPESVQLSPSPTALELTSPVPSPMHASFPSTLPSAPPTHSYSQGQRGLSRHLSMSSSLAGRPRQERDAMSEGSPMASLQKTLVGLHQRAQPHLENARYKAEAGLTRRGFVQHQNGPRWMMQRSEERLVSTDTGESGGDGDVGLGTDESSVDQDLDVDTGPEEPEGHAWEERLRRRRMEKGQNARKDLLGVERDNLKWPVGEGWRPL